MLESTEIRWFFKGNLPFIVNWSDDIDIHKKSVENRIDYYLLIPDTDCVGIKLRNSRLEIKWRRKVYEFNRSNLTISGFSENWIKWDWNHDKSSQIDMDQVFKKNEQNPWVEVRKKRTQKKFNIYDNKLNPISSRELYSDFALEVTELVANNQAWWSVGLDSFSGKVNPYFDQIIREYLIKPYNLSLGKESSYGYPHWLDQVF